MGWRSPDRRPFFMSNVAVILGLILGLGLPLSAQPFAARVSAIREVGGVLSFEIPSLRLKPSLLSAAPGTRLYVVTVAVGEEGIETEARRFVLMTSRGSRAPIGAGPSAEQIIPFDRIPDHQEVGVVLPSDTIFALTRRSARVVLEVGPREQVSFLYELPAAASVRALRLPDGRALTITP